MKRIKKNSLELRDDKYYLEGEPYTGIVYSIVDNVVESIFKVEDGLLSNKLVDVFGFESCNLSIDASHLEESLDEEPFVYENRRFTGVAYCFEDDFCVSAHLFENGYVEKEVGWFRTGVLGFYEGFSEGASEFSTWQKDGIRNSFKYFEKGSFRLEADFNTTGEMKRLSIFGPVLDRLSGVSDKILFPLILEMEELNKIEISNSLYLSGDGVNDGVFGVLISSSHFSNLHKLHLSNTSLTRKSIVELRAKNNIKEIVVDDDRIELTDAVEKFQLYRPDCNVILNQ